MPSAIKRPAVDSLTNPGLTASHKTSLSHLSTCPAHSSIFHPQTAVIASLALLPKRQLCCKSNIKSAIKKKVYLLFLRHKETAKRIASSTGHGGVQWWRWWGNQQFISSLGWRGTFIGFTFCLLAFNMLYAIKIFLSKWSYEGNGNKKKKKKIMLGLAWILCYEESE